MKIEAKLSWVLVNGTIHNVKDFSHLKPDLRPIAFCPECKREVTLKLGKQRIFHAAHKPQDKCILTQPETVLHLNAKLYVAEELKKQKPLLIFTYCQGIQRIICSNKKISEYISDWDEVLVEYHIDQFRPDIVLLKNGKPVGAVEIFVTHSIEPEKELHFKQLSIPWIEIDANVLLPKEEKDYWQINNPFQYRKLNKKFLEKWLCSSCEKGLKRHNNKKDKLRNPGEYKISAFRIIDFLYTDGSHYRSIFFAKKRIQNGSITQLLIDENFNTICEVKFITQEKSEKWLRDKFSIFLNSYILKGHILDSHMSWEKWEKRIPFSEMKRVSIHAIFPRRFSWSTKQEKWLPINSYKKLCWNNFFSEEDNYLKFLAKKIIRYNQLIIEKENLKNKKRKNFYYSAKDLPNQNNKDHIEFSQKDYSPINIPEAICVYCHQLTTNYWFYDKGTKTCKCRPCYNKKKESNNQ